MKWPVGRKLYTGFILLQLMIIGTGFIGVKGMDNLNNEMKEITTSWMPGVESINKIRYFTEHLLTLEFKYLINADDEISQKLLSEMEKTIANIENELNNYEKTIILKEDRGHFEILKKELQEYKSIHNNFLLMGKQIDIYNRDTNINEEEITATINAADKAFQEIQAQLNTLVAFKHEGALNSVSEGDHTYNAGRNLMLIVIVSAILFGIIVAYVLTQMIKKPLEKINANVKEIATGNLMNDSIQVKNRDELGVLAKEVTTMTKNLSHLVRQVGYHAQHVAAATEQVNANAEQTAKAAKQISSFIQEVSAGSEFQVKGAEEGATAVEEMAIGIQRIAEAASSVADSTADVSQKTNDGNEVIQNVVQQMATIRESVNDSSVVIQKLGERSQEIGKIIEVITGIADQTNLLALNAAIESARAGEHGRGFAVVADEVRKLAEQSRNSANQIAKLIEEIQEQTRLAVEQMAKGTEEVERGTTVVQNAGDMFSAISKAISDVSIQIEEVSSISEQLSAGSQEVTATIEELAQIARESSKKYKEIAASSDETLNSIEEITSATTSLSEMAQTLQKEINKFKV
ncbi:methyl-accepting chemotaxis protein [Calidifontibacillus erzurumensis]|uniref:Methyl-accepting chemotaxis protein n=1 Tax=Calidifontibacillus erzurumensis TaxID=2741433 RepID=A0A8J8GES8_9BACI|nr:methyl-accepting chemotaxis protein [Calidifontibacillus erzurumensis]NSL52337.1 methyl-accepting chemotaxis protein [Calidifontibacillus erzurumensis]